MSIIRGTKPDITPAQIVALLVAGVPVLSNLLFAFGIYTLSSVQADALTDTLMWGGAFAALLTFSDAAIRNGRNKRDGAVEAAAVMAQSAPPLTPITMVTGHMDMTGEALPTDREEFAEPETRMAPDPPSP